MLKIAAILKRSKLFYPLTNSIEICSPKNLFAAFRINQSKLLITFTVTHTNKHFVSVIIEKDDITRFAHSSNEMFNSVMITTTLKINSRKINIKVVKRNHSFMDYKNTALRDVVNDIVP